MGKFLIAAAVGIGVIALSATITGCRKESEEDLEFTQPTTPRKKDVDLFDEFYMSEEKKAPAPAPAAPATPAPAPAQTATRGAARQQPQPAAVPRGSYSFNPNGRYVVQVNSTALEGGANRMVSKLQGLGFPAYTAIVQNPTPELFGTYFRVRIGGFNSVSEARNFAETALVPAGYEFWVDRKANDNVGIQGAGFGSGAPQQFNQAPAPAPQPVAAAPAPAPQPVAPPPQPVAAPAPAPQPAAAPAPVPAPQPIQTVTVPAQTAPPPAPTPAPQPVAPPPQQPDGPVPSDWGVDDWGSDDW